MNTVRTKIHKWLPHLIGILFFAILPVFVFDRNDNRALFWIYTYYYQLAFMLIAFYVNFLVIVPRYFFGSKRWQYILIVVVFAILLLFISQLLYIIIDFDRLRTENFPDMLKQKPRNVLGLHPKIIDNFFLMLLVLGFSTGMAVIQRLRKNETQQKAIEKARVDSELAFLKNQISPHFFFNSLNNIYALIAIDADEAQEAVEKLSGLMRYLIYESDIKTVALKKEFEFTRNYIDLMRQRLTAKVKLETEIQENLPDVEIPPLIFIPFVENAFKHGVSYRENSFININLRVQNNSVIFECNNSIPQLVREPAKSGGLGIVNIKKRLELLYGSRAQLTMTNEENVHSVHLVIPLK